MIDEKEINDMYNFIDFLNDGNFMNKDYRQGILDALAFVKYKESKLKRIKEHLLKNSSSGGEKE